MNFLHLEYFYVVAKHEHMTNAAKELHMSQPALSRTISSLESELGVRLFDRVGTRIRLNTMGEIYLRYVNQIFKILHEGNMHMQDLACVNTGYVSYSIPESLFCTEIIKHFVEAHPNATFMQYNYTTDKIVSELERGTMDFAISFVPIEGTSIVWEELLTDEIGVLVSENHPFAHRTDLTIKDLKDERFVFNSNIADWQKMLILFCNAAGFEPDILFKGDEPYMVGQLIQQNLAIAFIPRFRMHTTENQIVGGNVFVPLQNPPTYKIGIAYVQEHYFSKLTLLLMEQIRAYFNAYGKPAASETAGE